MSVRYRLADELIELGNQGKFKEGLAVAQESLERARQIGSDQRRVLQHLMEVAEFLFQLDGIRKPLM